MKENLLMFIIILSAHAAVMYVVFDTVGSNTKAITSHLTDY